MNNLMYRGSSQQVKPSKVSRKSEKTYRGAVYSKLPKQAKKASVHTYRGVEFTVQKRKGACAPLTLGSC